MAITENERYQLVEGLIEVLGMERAETLLKCVLLEGPEQLATKQDLEVVDVRLRSEFGELRGDLGERFGELRSEFGELRGDLGERFGELRSEFGELRGDLGERFGELRGEFGTLRGEFGELRGYVDSALARQTRIYLLALLGFAVTVWIAVLVPLIV